MSSPYPQSLSAALVATPASDVCQALDCISVHHYGFTFVVHGGVYLVFELARSLQISPQIIYHCSLEQRECVLVWKSSSLNPSHPCTY